MAQLRIGFIINPISGTRHKTDLPQLIARYLDSDIFLPPEIQTTQYAGHATQIAAQMAASRFDVVVAVGGDGTVNETARGLIDTSTALGIVPVGSGNGLAKTLHVPSRPQHAIQALSDRFDFIDYGLAGEHCFFCTCGAGFDALISHAFAHAGHRGLTSYIEQVVEHYISYKPLRFSLRSDDFSFEQEAFLITFANASQYGNNIYIAPNASLRDGQIDVSILSRFPIHAIPNILFRLRTKRIGDSYYSTTFRTSSVLIDSSDDALFHIDGEAVNLTFPIQISLRARGLKVNRQDLKKKDRTFRPILLSRFME